MTANNGRKVRVFIVDDSAIIQKRLIEMFSEFEDIQVVGQAEDVTTAIDSIRELKPDMVILDIRIRGGSGIDVLKKIRKERPAPVVIVFTQYPYPQYLEYYMREGAHCFLDKTTGLEEISQLIKQLSPIFKT